MALKKPEISRICPFEGADVVQIFGENFTKDTELYVWYNKNAKINYIQCISTHFETKDESNAYKRWLAKELPVDCTGIENILNELPKNPPEDAIVFRANDVFEHVIYFGEEAGEQPIDGRYKRVESGVSVMWLKNEAGFSEPFIANRPEIWNRSAKTISPGERITFYGRSFGEAIGFDDGTHFAKIGVVRSLKTGEFIRIEGLEDTCYASSLQQHITEYRIPKDLPEGDYEFYLYGGCGRYGWSEAVPLTVKNDFSLNKYFREKWNRTAGEIVKMPKVPFITIEADDISPYADYSDKIQEAIDSLEETGGIVKLSSGIFPLSKTIMVRSGVVLLGSGISTVLKASDTAGLTQDWAKVLFCKKPNGKAGWAVDWLGFLKEHNEGAVLQMLDNSGVEALKIELGNGANIGILVADDKSDRANNVFCNNVTINGMNLSELEMDGYFGATAAAFLVGARTENLTLYCCDLNAVIPLYFLPSRHTYAKIVNNNIICRPRQINESAVGGLRNSIISNNLFEGGRRSFVANSGFSNNWVYQNRSTDVNRAANALEAYMSEHGKGVWNGKAAGFGKGYIDVADSYKKVMSYSPDASYEDNREEYHYFLFVLNGRGFGQYKEVIKIEEKEKGCRFYLDSPFNVEPDLDTAFTLLYGTHHNLWVHNSATLSNGHSQFIWDCGFENIIDTHQIDLAAGMRFHSYHGPNPWGGGYSVCAFNEISHCQVRSSGVGITFASRRRNFNYDAPEHADLKPTLGVFGNSVKECAFDGSVGLIYVKNQPSWFQEEMGAGVEIDGAYNRIVGNYIFGYEKAAYIISDCEGNCFARNVYKGQREKFVGLGKPCGVDAE